MGNATLNSLYRNLGLEDLIEEPTEPAPVEDLSGEESVEGELLEVEEAGGEVATDNEQAEELSADVDTLEGVNEAMESAAANGGLSRDAVIFARLTVDNVRRRWGIEQDPIPSMESFGDVNSRGAATRMSMEGIGETIKAMWVALMAKLRKMWESVKGFAIRVTDAAPKLKARAEAIIKKAGETKGKSKSDKLEGFKKVGELHLSGVAPHPNAFLGALEAAKEVAVLGLGAKSADTVNAVVDDLLKVMDELAKDSTRTISGVEKLPEKLGQYAGAIGANSSIGGAPEGTSVKGSRELPGGQAVEVIIGQVKSEAGQPISLNAFANTFSVKIRQHGKKTPGEGEVMTTLAVDEVKKVAGIVVDICKALTDYRNSWKTREAAQKRMDDAVKRAVATVDKKKEGGAKEAASVKDAAMAVATMWRKTASFDAEVVSYTFRTARATLAYCDKSLNNYGEGEQKAAEGEGAAA